MKTLELKDLAPYLPYVLKAVWFNGESIDVSCENIRGLFYPKSDFSDSKLWTPILRPLSDLTKPCLEGGKIPIVELAKISDPEFKELMYTKIKFGLFGCRYIDKNHDIIVFAYHENIKSFGTHFEFENNEFTITQNQLQLFEKLFEWHFDVSGLIEAGLAIDINTLK